MCRLFVSMRSSLAVFNACFWVVGFLDVFFSTREDVLVVGDTGGLSEGFCNSTFSSIGWLLVLSAQQLEALVETLPLLELVPLIDPFPVELVSVEEDPSLTKVLSFVEFESSSGLEQPHFG